MDPAKVKIKKFSNVNEAMATAVKIKRQCWRFDVKQSPFREQDKWEVYEEENYGHSLERFDGV